jgi:hypothetical protein
MIAQLIRETFFTLLTLQILRGGGLCLALENL